MYEQFFGLTEKPFSIQPDPSFLYWGRTHRLAYAMLKYGVLNHAGISVISGEVGCGKTTLIHRLLDQLSDTHSVALMSNIQEGRGDLLSWVLMGFGQPFAGKSHVELFSQLQNFFISEYAAGRRVVLIIDEAQNLSIDMLEELRLLSNINAGKDQLLQLILVGQPELKGLLNKPELLQLAQRVGSDFHLTPLNKKEVHAYIDTRLAIAGCRRRIFTDRAVDLIAEQSRGVPRVINIIADTALVYAFSSEELVVGVEMVKSVIRDKTQFGVFGLASDEGAAAPLSEDDAEIDAFAGNTRRLTSSDENDLSAENDDDDDGATGEHEEETPPANLSPYGDHLEQETPASKPQTSPTADVAAHVTARVSSYAAPAGPARAAPREESSVTGVVIVGTDKKLSPEAAIQSAGDGRAIVFVAVGAAPQTTAAARNAGAIVVEGDAASLSTGGRARNAGYRQLKNIAPHVKYVQFLDADCALDPNWISTAEKFMARRSEVAILEGEFTTPSGAAALFPTLRAQKRAEGYGEIQYTVTGSALMRVENFEAVGGFRGDLPTAETEDLCVRLRRRGARVWRSEETMALCSRPAPGGAGWWSRSFKRGFDNAFCASLHGGPPERLGVVDTLLAVFWGFLYPLGVICAAAAAAVAVVMLDLHISPILAGVGVAAAGAGVLVLRFIASILRRGVFKSSSWGAAFVAVMGRFPAFLGACAFWLRGKR